MERPDVLYLPGLWSAGRARGRRSCWRHCRCLARGVDSPPVPQLPRRSCRLALQTSNSLALRPGKSFEPAGDENPPVRLQADPPDHFACALAGIKARVQTPVRLEPGDAVAGDALDAGE